MNKVCLDVAQAEFDRLAEQMDWEFDSDNSDDETSKVSLMNRVVKLIMRGKATINDNCEISYIPKRSDCVESLTFHEPLASELSLHAKYDKASEATRILMIISNITGTPPVILNKMKATELVEATEIAALFLARQ